MEVERGSRVPSLRGRRSHDKEEEDTFTITTSLTFTITTSEHTVAILHKTAYLVTPQQCDHKRNR